MIQIYSMSTIETILPNYHSAPNISRIIEIIYPHMFCVSKLLRVLFKFSTVWHTNSFQQFNCYNFLVATNENRRMSERGGSSVEFVLLWLKLKIIVTESYASTFSILIELIAFTRSVFYVLRPKLITNCIFKLINLESEQKNDDIIQSNVRELWTEDFHRAIFSILKIEYSIKRYIFKLDNSWFSIQCILCSN